MQTPVRTVLGNARLAVGAAMVILLVAVGCNRGGQSQPSEGAQATIGGSDSDAKSGPSTMTRSASLSRIRRLISTGNRADAQQAIQTHLLRYPDDPNAMVLASGLLKADGQIDDAVAMLDSAAESEPDGGSKWRRQAAFVLFESGRPLDGIARMETLLSEQPELDEARHELAAMLNGRGFRFDANEHVRQLCRRGQARLDELKGLMFPARSFTGLSEKPSVDDVQLNDRIGAMNVARAMYGEGDVLEAVQVLSSSQLVRDKHPAAMAFLGQLLIESQQFDRFEEWGREVPDASKRYPAYWLARGGWAAHEREFDVAIGQFAQAILREPGDLGAVDRMTQSLAAGGYTEAHQQFRRRGVLINRLMTLTRRVFSSPEFDPERIEEMSALLTDSGRPAVALAWYRIALMQMGSPPAGINKLNDALAMLDEQDLQEDNRRKQLCGLDVSKFPSDLKVANSISPQTSSRSAAVTRYAQEINPAFVNVASKVGLDFVFYNGKDQVKRDLRLFEQLGAGVACLDFDRDGRVDFYLGQASCEPPDGRGSRPNVLSRSLGDGFVVVTESAHCDDRGYSSGITAGDWNQDGFPDLVVANLDRNTLLINQGDGTFVRHPGGQVWNQSYNSTSLAMGDVNGDHLPDIVEVNYVDDPTVYHSIQYKADGTPVHWPAPLDYRPCADRLFLSRGDGALDGRWLDESRQVAPATGLGVVLTDLNGDPGNEIFVANDHLANHLWQRQSGADGAGDRRVEFQETAAVRGVAFGASGAPLGCMGVAVSDFDENGRQDLHVTNFENEWNNQYMQDENGFFDDLVVSYGLDQPTYKMLGFGTQALDYDNNTAVDLVIGNGHVEDYADSVKAFQMPTMMLTLAGSKFVVKEVDGDRRYWESGHLSRSLATCDWNNDGRTDFVVTDLIEPFALLENRTPTPYRWLQLRLVGTTTERDAIGAVVSVSAGGRKVTKVVQSGDGYMCKNQPILCFGLGTHQGEIERVQVRWPDGTEQTLSGLAANRRWMILQSESEPFELDLHQPAPGGQ